MSSASLHAASRALGSSPRQSSAVRIASCRPRHQARRQPCRAEAAAPPTTIAATPATAADDHPPVAESAPQASTAAAVQPAWLGGSWSKAWYAVCAVKDFDDSRPQPFSLLGKELVIWRAPDGAWGCLEDRCPHRAVPLSEGKVWIDGTLMCSYHGWRFAEDGACKAIPQAPSAEAATAAAASQRACAVAHPIREAQGMLFVWGEGGAAAAQESAALEPQVCPLTERTLQQGGSMMTITPHYTRDLPYDYAALMENVCDPSHVPFSHHGVMGNRDLQKHGMWDMQRAGPLAMRWEAAFGEITITYQPPGLITYASKLKRGGESVMSFWVTPLAPGRSRITLTMATNSAERLPAPFKLLASLPPWVDHVRTRSAVFDGDNSFLHGQDRLVAAAARQGGGWRSLYFMPTTADSLVSAARNWLDSEGGGGPFGSLADPGSPAAQTAAAAAAAQAVAAAAGLPGSAHEAGRRQLLDRYHQHVVHCSSCRDALKTTMLLRQVVGVAAVVAAAAALLPFLTALAPAASTAAGALPAAASPVAAAAAVAWLPALLAGVLGAAWVLLGRLRANFIFKDWVHAFK